MKKVAILFIVLLTSSFLFAQNTYVPDDKFEQALIDLGYDTTLDDSVLTANISGVTTLDVSSKEISDLTGIEAFVALESLSCAYNELTSLDVTTNTALTLLKANDNQLTSLDVSKNTALTTLRCYSNQLTSLDVSKNTALTTLSSNSNQLTSLDVSKNTALTTLSCAYNELTSIDVSKNIALTGLYCHFNQLTSLDVSNNTALTTLWCGSNNLTSLDVSNNTALTTLWCASNNLTSLDVSNNTALEVLQCYSNQLTSIDVSKNTALINLSSGYNQLTSLDVSKNVALTVLHCGANQLTSLDVSNNTALEVLSCSYNQLTSLDVSNNTALEVLSCNSNQLTSLDVSKNTALTQIDSRDNQLTSLDLSKNTALTQIDSRDNQLTSINMKNGITDALTKFRVTSNPNLYCIETLDPTYATTNWTDIDAGVTFSIICSDVIAYTSISDITIEEDKVYFVTFISKNDLGADITFTAESDNDSVSVSLTSSSLTVTPNPNWSGVANIKVSATAGGSTLSKTFKLTVTPVQDTPTAFEWVSSPSDTIYITQSNLADTYTLEWDASIDIDGDVINYLIYAKIGLYPTEEVEEITDTAFELVYEEILEQVFEGSPVNGATVRFNVKATDGIDTVDVTGDSRVIYVNRYDYLSVESEGIPTEFALHENYPNPFNPSTTLRFDLPEVSNITLTIFNMLGQKIRTYDMQSAAAGYHTLKWNATNDYGDPVGAGVYLYQLQTKDFVKTRKMVLLK